MADAGTTSTELWQSPVILHLTVPLVYLVLIVSDEQ